MDFLPFVVDGIVILIFVACIFNGYRKGFVKMLLSIIAVSLSILLANILSAPLAQWASDEFVEDAVSEYVESYVNDVLADNGVSTDMLAEDYFDGAKESISEAIPEEIADILDNYDISVEDIFDNISPEDTVKTVSKKITRNIQKSLVMPVLEVIAFVIVYLLCSMVLSIIVELISSLFKIPLVKNVNQALGAALGTVKGVAVIAIVCIFAVLASSFFPGNEFADAVSDAALTNAVNDVALEIIK